VINEIKDISENFFKKLKIKFDEIEVNQVEENIINIKIQTEES
jgi:hypothetical protein